VSSGRVSSEVLVVDGYNMIGAWPELRELAKQSLEDARDRLIELLSDDQGFTGRRVIVVFDAYEVPGLGAKIEQGNVEIIYTKEKETADECIERLVDSLQKRGVQIYVATSDMVEQHVVFGKGALRISARELLWQVEENRRHVREKIRWKQDTQRNSFDTRIDETLRDRLEKWRRSGK